MVARRIVLCAGVAAVMSWVVQVHGDTVADEDDLEGTYLWDLNVDPLESTSVYGDSSYTSQQTELESLLTTWQGLAISCDSQYTSDSLYVESVWSACGGVCPNVTRDDYELDVTQIYSASNTPNIVFMLADDWGHNDVGFRSTYMSWTTPTIDTYASQGISLENYFSHYFCTPSRGALMTGRYASRLGMIDNTEGCELPLSEGTIAQEMKSAGYRTYMVGKWDLGVSSRARTPMNRGFDEYYGFYSSYIDYYTKENEMGYLDLQDGFDLETDPTLVNSSYHSVYLFQDKATAFIEDHAANYPDTPMFLYYAIQLVHYPYLVPSTYTDRCSSEPTSDQISYCGLNLMLDEVVANTTCVLSETGLLNNTIVLLISDNGGNHAIAGNNDPYRGYKFDQFRGGLSANAFIYSPLLDVSLQGTKYYGQMHVTDWLPTLMNLATAGAWNGSLVGNTIDGVDMWDAIMTNSSTLHSTIVHYASVTSTAGSIQKDMIKYDYLQELPSVGSVTEYFTSDLDPSLANYLCEDVKFTDVLSLDGHPRTSEDLYSMGIGNSVSKQTETTAADVSVHSTLKSTGDYLVWLFSAGLLLSLLVVLSNHVLKRDTKYDPIDSSNLDLLAASSLETGKQDPYQKSLN